MNLEVANTILAQLGGNQFVAMTGAKDLMGDATSLTFKVGSNAKKITAVRVVLDPSDTYTVEFYKGRGINMAKARELSDVYADSLVELFERETGLYTTIGGAR